MGIDVDGSMLVGAHGGELKVPDGVEMDFYEWAEKNGIESFAQHYDADQSFTYYGFAVDDVDVSDIDGKWLKDTKESASKFEALTGVRARLIGTQSVW